MKVDHQELNRVFGSMKGRVKYQLGAKAGFHIPVEQIERIDCSGFVRYLLFYATGVIIPDGSQNQLAWARRNLRRLDKYSNVEYAEDDPSRIFIGFLTPDPGHEWPRHVWLIRGGKTMESFSSRGVSWRPWNAAVLSGCRNCFEVTG